MSDYKQFIGKRYGSLVVVAFVGTLQKKGDRRRTVWRANCDCDASGKNYVYDTIRVIKSHGRCDEYKKLSDRRRKHKSLEDG